MIQDSRASSKPIYSASLDIGTYPLKWSPTNKSIQGGVRAGLKNTAGNQDQLEILGSLAPTATMSGFLESTLNAQAIFDLYNFFTASPTSGYDNRPCGMGFFSSDAGGTGANCFPIWTGVGALTERYFEDVESTQQYYLNYRFTLQSAGVIGVTQLNKTAISQGLVNFTMPAGQTGWLAGIGLAGACSFGGRGMAIDSITDTTATNRGSCPQLGTLLTTTPIALQGNIDVILPVLGGVSSVDPNGGQSILLSNEPGGTWKISFHNSFTTVPSNVYALVLPG